MKKTMNIWNILSTVVLVLLLAAEALVAANIWMLKMLPVKYIAALLAAMVLADLALGIMMLPKTGKWQKKNRYGRRITAYMLSVLVIVVCLVGNFAVSKLDETMNAITQKPTVNALVGVYVLSDDPAQSLDDAYSYTFAVTDSFDADNTQSALEQIESSLGISVETKHFDTVFAMVDALYAGEVETIILNAAYIDILEELENYSDFSSRTRSIYTYSVMDTDTSSDKKQESPVNSTPADATAPEPTEIVEKEFDPTTDPFVIYLSGSDTRSSTLTKSRSDVNILAAVNPTTKQVLLINTPRDYFVPNPAGNGALDKLTHCGLYGAECSMEALSDLYNQPISYYAQINFTGFETLIDAIGGITVYSDISFSYIQQGENHLNGSQALGFARERYAFRDGDNARGRNQMKVITAVIKKLSSGAIITNYSDILDSLQGMFVTDIPSDTISRLIKMQLADMAQWEVLSYAVTGYNGTDAPYSMAGLYAYVMYPNEEDVARASNLIGRLLDGQVLTPEDVAVS